jgi:hypothetical protein
MKHLLTLALLLCLGTFASAQIPSYVPTNGLVGWWPFNGNANDESGNGNHGTVNGATLAADRFGNPAKAYSFDGNSKINLGRLSIIDTLDSNRNISYSLWFLADSIQSSFAKMPLISKRQTYWGTAGFSQSYFTLHGGGQDNRRNGKNICTGFIDAHFYSSQLLEGGVTNDNRWHCLIATKSGNAYKMYFDGTLFDSILDNSVLFSIDDMIIGFQGVWGFENEKWYKGHLDDIAIYNRALTAAEVQQLYTGQSACNLTVNLATSDTLAACGNSITLNAGNPGANYLWNTGDSTPSISATQSGWYSATVNQNNCSATDSVYVNLLLVDLGNDTTVCMGNSISLSSGDFIGKTGPAGGIIFYDKQNNLGGWRYLELAPNDIGNAPWGCFGRVIGSTSDSIGFGDSNTRDIVQNCGANTAAYLAENFVYNGFSDWYLPSILELEKIMQNVYQKGLGNFNASNGQYWSSTEAFSIGSKIISISNGSYQISDDNKQWSDYIRVCRKVNGTNATSTLWSTGDTTPTINVTPTQTTTYYCTVSDGISTCTDSVTVFVTQPPVLTLPDTLRSATRPVVLAPGNASSYRWSTGDTTANLSVNTAGTYSVTASNAAGCSSADTVLVLFSNPAPALPATAAGVFNYQASVVSGGKPLSNRSLSVRFTVADSSATNYSEIQQITTDARGHFATQVGAGTALSGSLSDISWWDALPRTLKTEVDTNGSGSWVVLGNSSLVAVPVSLYALRSGDGSRSIYGSFDSNGNVVSGRGFTVTPLGNGKFELVFQQPFTELPNVFLEFTGNGVFSKKIWSINTQKTTIEISGNPDRIQFEAKGK